MTKSELPPIPTKRYFTIGEVGELCAVKPHVLRYWEQEFTQLRPMKRQGNRRYYQHHEVLIIRRIRELLYEQGFSINGARSKLQRWVQRGNHVSLDDEAQEAGEGGISSPPLSSLVQLLPSVAGWNGVLQELQEIRKLLTLRP